MRQVVRVVCSLFFPLVVVLYYCFVGPIGPSIVKGSTNGEDSEETKRVKVEEVEVWFDVVYGQQDEVGSKKSKNIRISEMERKSCSEAAVGVLKFASRGRDAQNAGQAFFLLAEESAKWRTKEEFAVCVTLTWCFFGSEWACRCEVVSCVS